MINDTIDDYDDDVKKICACQISLFVMYINSDIKILPLDQRFDIKI